MNRRLQKGVLLGRFTATILASVLMMSSLPVAASETVSIQASDTTVKTLPPLAEASVASPTTAVEQEAAAVLKPALQYSPTGGASNDASLVRPDDSTAATAPISGSSLTPAAAPLTAEDNAPATTETADPTATVVQEGAALAAAVPTAPEVTAPEAVPSEPADGTALAQKSSNSRGPLDPAYRKLPAVRETIKIRRGFDKFPSNSIIHNLAFRDTPVKEVVSEISRRGNLNIILDKSVVGRITGDLHDVTLNEAMDTVLASAGLQYRQLDNSTIIIGSPNALFNLGLNRPFARTFKLSYTSAFDVANLLWASVFNRGFIPDFTQAIRNRTVSSSKETPSTKSAEEVARASQAPAPGGGTQTSKSVNTNTVSQDQNEESEQGEEFNQTTRPDAVRTIRGVTREQLNEGTGFNSGAIDPGSQTIRARAAVVTDFNVDQNGGAAIVIPDTKNQQIIVVGTEQDLQIAEEAIRVIDRRPKQVHIQSSLIELTNQGIRQLGASLNLQGEGASGTILGGAGAPLISFLPGLGSAQQFLTNIINGSQVTSSRVSGIPPVPIQFSGGTAGNFQSLSYGSPGIASTINATTGVISTGSLGTNNLTNVPGPPGNGFAGFLGNSLPVSAPTIAGVQAVPQAQTGFNFLTLGKGAGGRANIATLPTALNLSLNLVLQTNKAKILANPSVIVTDNTESLISLANEVVHKVTTTISLGVVSTNVELVQAGVFLNVLPRITEDGFIVMRLRPQVSSPLGGPQVFAGGSVVVTLLNIRQIMTQEVRVKDGQTLVLGGLFTEQEAGTLAKVPYLAEAPILGAIFRNSIKGRNRTELMLLITPKVVEEGPTGQPLAESGASPLM